MFGLRLPFQMIRPDGRGVAQFAATDFGVMVRSQIDGVRETRLVGPLTADDLARGLVSDGWHLQEVA
jgi:hypothetical protein